MNRLKIVKESSHIKEVYYNLYQDSPIAILEEDLSEIKTYFNSLKKKGVPDISAFFNKHPDEIIYLVDKIKIVAANESAMKLCQAGDLKEICQRLCHVFNKQSYEIFKDELIALSEGETEYHCETVMQTLNGVERQIILKMVVASGYENTLSKGFLHIIDISNIKEEKENLEKSEEKYRIIFENAYDAIFLIDTITGIVLDANRKAEQLLGLLKDNIMGMHFTQLFPEEEKDYYRKLLPHTGDRHFFSENTVVCHENGDKIPVCICGKTIELRPRKLFLCLLREMHTDELQTRGSNIINHDISNASLKKLTQREIEILSLIASGFSNKQIANRLYISPKTIETHRTNMMDKLNIHKSADLVRFAITQGLIGSHPSA